MSGNTLQIELEHSKQACLCPTLPAATLEWHSMSGKTLQTELKHSKQQPAVNLEHFNRASPRGPLLQRLVRNTPYTPYTHTI